MALIKLSGASIMSGSVNGMTYSRNRFGQYARNRAVPVNPNSTNQVAVRSAFGGAAVIWKTLDQAVRDGWEAYAAGTPEVNAIGDVIYLTGLNMFARYQSLFDRHGEVLTGPPLLPGKATLSNLTANISGNDDDFEVAFSGAQDWNADGGFLLVQISRPLNKTINFFKGPFRNAGKIDGAATPVSSPQTLTYPWGAIQPTSDVREFVRFVGYDPATLRLTSPLIVQLNA